MIDISVSNLTKEFEVGKKILDGLTFQVDQGERVGLLGKNGAGKTTVFKIITGEMDYDDGQVMTGRHRSARRRRAPRRHEHHRQRQPRDSGHDAPVRVL